MQAIHDDWVRTWNEGDGNAAVALFADGGLLFCSFSCGANGEASGDEIVRVVEKGYPLAPGWPITNLEILSVVTSG